MVEGVEQQRLIVCFLALGLVDTGQETPHVAGDGITVGQDRYRDRMVRARSLDVSVEVDADALPCFRIFVEPVAKCAARERLVRIEALAQANQRRRYLAFLGNMDQLVFARK
jgi:hypothetical protein